MQNKAVAAGLAAFLTLTVPAAARAAESGDAESLAIMRSMNAGLKAMWMDIRLESIDYLTLGTGRPSDRLLNQPFRWVPDDARRRAAGTSITWLIDPSWGVATASGLSQETTAEAIGRAMATWASDGCLRGTPLIERPHPGGDVTVTDYFFGTGGFGNPFAADVVHGGWMPADTPFFDRSTVALSATYVFIDPVTGEPTDVDGDGNLDAALNEIYYNDAFTWSHGGALPTVDVETTALHEVGHALDLGHFGSPPEAVMNPVYSGVRRELEPLDHAGLCTVWGR
ncbi:MAG TPA: matrixin family metalloprotease [Thermoanaerobaculia bacterium]|nr:matrixin family metalloprotease [Thermoanaerobaculia bacterium]